MAVRRDIIVIGTSAGGVQALRKLVAALPPDLPASIFAVLHIPSSHISNLAEILSRDDGLPVVQPAHDQPIEPRRIYVAPPDHHMLVERGRVRLWRGPKENRHRPAINPLFRSAAIAYGERVVGAVLTGALDDGTAGLWWVKKHGGLAIVQDPREAVFPDMPRNAIEHVPVDHVVTIAAMAPLLVQTVCCDSVPLERNPIEERPHGSKTIPRSNVP